MNNPKDKYFKKYLKYKNKYLKLKKGGNRNCKFTVIPNTGSLEGMSNQCLWISIKDYLNTFLENPITLTELRNNVGLNRDSEHEMFDNDDENFVNAINRICDIYDLTIKFYLIDGNGNLITNLDENGIAESFMCYGHGRNIVNITSYGRYHFQLITGGYGLEPLPNFILSNGVLMNKVEEIKPKVFYKDEFVNMDSITDLKDLNDITIENEISTIENNLKLFENYKKIYEENIKKNSIQINEIIELIVNVLIFINYQYSHNIIINYLYFIY